MMAFTKFRKLIVHLFLLMQTFNSSLSDNRIAYGTINLALNNKVISSNTLAIYSGDQNSLLQCADMCLGIEKCLSFFFNTITKVCQTHSTVFQDTSVATAENGSTYYQILKDLSTAYWDKDLGTTDSGKDLSTIDSDETNGCSNGWIIYSGSCYLFSDQQMEWAEAGSACKTLNATLVTVENYEEDQFLLTAALNIHGILSIAVDYWMGGSDLEKESEWIWSGSNLPFTYTNWCPLCPDNRFGQDCLQLDGLLGFCWNDASCNVKERFICEKHST